jgi:hypothetical protein
VRRRAHRTLTRLLDRLVRPGRRIGQLAWIAGASLLLLVARER